jgi:DNA polymerase III subunit epsilon
MQIDRSTPLVYVDLETTGTSARQHRVIEVGILRTERGVITDEYSTLVDPGEPVPSFVTGLTGIRSDMLVGAPPFSHVAHRIKKILEGGVLVAHNAHFDHSFLVEEFRRVGMDLLVPYLCTARLSRTLFPHENRHSLEAIIERYGLEAGSRHRAFDDARVLVQLMEVVRGRLEEKDLHKALQDHTYTHHLMPRVQEDILRSVPDRPGVYSLYDQYGSLLYTGRSRNMLTRIRAHFAKDHPPGPAKDMLSRMRSVRHQTTGGELGALLLEKHLVSQHQPEYGVSPLPLTMVVAREYIGEGGYHMVQLEEVETLPPDKDTSVVGIFRTKDHATATLDAIIREHSLCRYRVGLEESAPCSDHATGTCAGACMNQEKHRHYNRRSLNAFTRTRIKDWPFEGPIAIEEFDSSGVGEFFIVDRWRILSALHTDGTNWKPFVPAPLALEYDIYMLLSQELLRKRRRYIIHDLSRKELLGPDGFNVPVSLRSV